MSVSRRRLLRDTPLLGALSPMVVDVLDQPSGSAASATLPPLEVIALNRMAYGPRPGDLARVRRIGLDAYIDEQLNPSSINDSACEARISAALLKLRYPADAQGRYPAVNELRPLTTLTKQASELWPLAKFSTPMDYQERIRPFYEVRAATWLRAVYSERQLLEVLVDFWHNHFNVNALSEVAIACTLPVYDRDVIRKNCLGNFRTFLEDVAKSTAMLYYLDNVSSRAGGGEGPNENYARELFELHTLGSDNYLKFYNDRSQVGLNEDGHARGYIDDDIYEAARCLSGWTVANGHWERPTLDNGTFYFDYNWHDTSQKIVLGVSIPRNPSPQDGMKDAQKVFDMLARHRGTARYLCTKLSRRLIADAPPASVIEAAVATWMSNLDAPDQLKKVVATILRSPEFKTTWGQKIKRPFEALVSYLRATNAQLRNDEIDPNDPNKGNYWSGLTWLLNATGHRLFEWPTPTGHPDVASYWASTNGLLQRWNQPYLLRQSWSASLNIDIKGQTDALLPGASCIQIVDFWIERLCGFTITPTVRQALIDFMAQGFPANEPPKPTVRAPDWNNPAALVDRFDAMVQLLAMCPDFQTR